MQDRTIDNALIALRKKGGPQGKIAEALLDMRGVRLPRLYKVSQSRRGQTSRYVLDALGAEPMTCSQVVDMLGDERSDLSRREAYQRVYNALLRLEAKGVVRRDEDRKDQPFWRSS